MAEQISHTALGKSYTRSGETLPIEAVSVGTRH